MLGTERRPGLGPLPLRVGILLALSACPSPAPDTGVLDPEATDASITSLTVMCEGGSGVWTIDANTDAWSGGGQLTLSANGTYVEAHPIPSVDAALDGSSDHLHTELAVVADFRDVSVGGSTWFNCGTPGLQGLFIVYSRDGERVTDCRRFGVDAALWAEWNLDSCPSEIEVESH